jgi:hypothetical protein
VRGAGGPAHRPRGALKEQPAWKGALSAAEGKPSSSKVATGYIPYSFVSPGPNRMDFPPEMQWLRLGHSVGGGARPIPSSREDRLAGLLAGIAAVEAKLATLEKAAAAAVVPPVGGAVAAPAPAPTALPAAAALAPMYVARPKEGVADVDLIVQVGGGGGGGGAPNVQPNNRPTRRATLPPRRHPRAWP